jgi:hypothetical protein
MIRKEILERLAASSHAMGRIPSILLPVALAMLAFTACDRRDPQVEPAPSSPPPNTAAPTAQNPAPTSGGSTSGDMTDPSKGPGAEVTEKGGTESGMAGGASGTVSSGGKPGSGTDAGAGTGAAAQSSTGKEEKEK